ncbi:hypothetical protein Tco_0108572, partial [Tanacetum coccineum]
AGQLTVIRVAGHGFKRVRSVGLGKGSSFAYRSLGESVALVVKASQPNNVTIALASSEGLTPESKLARHCFNNSKRDLTGVITAKILDTERCIELKMGSHISVVVASRNLYDTQRYIDSLRCKDN